MSDSRWMRRALRLARRGEGAVEPNPMVGCVLVRDDQIVGEGWHQRFGGPHAEVQALQDAGGDARGATAYVTLEPCNHHGKTPPCADALIEAGVARVVIAATDPSPLAAGGARRLRDAGLEVTLGLREKQANALIAPFAKRLATRLPYLILKWAMTVDGAIATASGDSKWISGERARRRVHRWRGRVDAIMVGAGTVHADDPLLTARDVEVRRTARRVIVDPRLTTPAASQLVKTAGEIPTTIATAATTPTDAPDQADRLRAAGVELLTIEGQTDASGALPLTPVLRHLVDAHDATNVLVEGGATLGGALLNQRLVDELRLFIAGKALADGQGLPPLRQPGREPTQRINEAIDLQLRATRRLGNDAYLRYTVPTESHKR